MGNVSYKSKERPQVVIESAFNQGGTATRTWNCIEDKGFEISPDDTYEPISLAGIGFETGELLVAQACKGTIKGFLDLNDFPYWLLTRYGAPNVTTLVAGAYRHEFIDNPYLVVVPKTFGFEAVDDNSGRPFKVYGVTIPGLKLDTEAKKSPTLSATIEGTLMVGSGVTPSTGGNASFLLTVLGAPTGGSFVLQDPDTGANVIITWTATYAASALQTAIRTLGGNYTSATVSGSAGGPYTVTVPTGAFIKLIELIYVINGSNTFVGGTAPTANVAFIANGGMKLHPQMKVGPLVTICFADSLADLDNAPVVVSENYKLGITIADFIEQRFLQNPTSLSARAVGQGDASKAKDMITANMAFDDSVATLIAAAQASTNQFIYCRVQWVGPQIASTGYYYTIQLDVATRPKWAKNGETDNIRDVDFDLPFHMDLSAGFRARWQITTAIADFTAN